eukprot:158063_1
MNLDLGVMKRIENGKAVIYCWKTKRLIARGSGSFIKRVSLHGKGCLAENDTHCVVKILECQDKNDLMHNEVKCLKKMEHNENIINLYGYREGKNEKQCFLLLEEWGHNLASIIYSNKSSLSETMKLRFANQIIDAVSQCQIAGIIQIDIKASNILVHNDIIKLCDFGIDIISTNDAPTKRLLAMYAKKAKIQHDEDQHATARYMAPEILYSRTVDRKCAVWNVSLLLIELISESVVDFNVDAYAEEFKLEPNYQHYPNQLLAINIGCSHILPQNRPIFISSIRNALKANPRNRIHIEKLGESVWMKQIGIAVQCEDWIFIDTCTDDEFYQTMLKTEQIMMKLEEIIKRHKQKNRSKTDSKYFALRESVLEMIVGITKYVQHGMVTLPLTTDGKFICYLNGSCSKKQDSTKMDVKFTGTWSQVKKHQSKLIHHFGDVSVAKYKATNMNKNTIYQHYIQGKSLSELSQWANKYKAQSDINDEKEENKVNDIALAEVNNPINMDPIHKALLETIASEHGIGLSKYKKEILQKPLDHKQILMNTQTHFVNDL